MPASPPTKETLPPLPDISMPPAERALMEDHYRRARMILEYGSGGSTVFATRHTSAQIISIESDAAWAENLRAGLVAEGSMRPGVEILHADIGPTKEWGMPLTHNEWRRYWALPMGIWQSGRKPRPDVVMIDGRFRLGCFAAVLLSTEQPVTVLWDDYTNRKYYHAAEEWVPVAEKVGRMARFEVTPRALTNADFVRLLPLFFSSR